MALSKRAWRPRKRAWRRAMLFCFRFNAKTPIKGVKDLAAGERLERKFTFSPFIPHGWGLTLAITFLAEVIGLSYCTFVFRVTRPVTCICNFLRHDLDLEV